MIHKLITFLNRCEMFKTSYNLRRMSICLLIIFYYGKTLCNLISRQ